MRSVDKHYQACRSLLRGRPISAIAQAYEPQPEPVKTDKSDHNRGTYGSIVVPQCEFCVSHLTHVVACSVRLLLMCLSSRRWQVSHAQGSPCYQESSECEKQETRIEGTKHATHAG